MLVEKPLAGSVDDAEALVRLAKKQGRLLAVGHVFLFNGGIRAVKNLIARGDLGSVRVHFFDAHEPRPIPHRRECPVGPRFA